MKKLLLGAILTIGYAFGANAQVQLCTTNFPNNAIPLTWTQQLPASDPTNGGWQFSNTVPGTFGADYMPVSGNGYFAFVDDIDNNGAAVTNYDTLYTNVFSCVGYNHVYLSFDIWYQGYYNPNNNDAEKVTIAVSTDGGHTWTTAITNPYGGWTTQIYDLSSLIANKATVEVAFTYTDGGAQLIGMGLDNVSIYSPLSYDLSVTSQNNPFLMQVGKPYSFSGAIANFGGDSVVSMDMNYSVDNIPSTPFPISGIVGFNGLTSYNWTDGNAFTPPLAGIYTVKFWANNLNGGNADQNHANDTLTTTFWAIDSVKTRQAVYEECTGQSCVFCMIAAPNMDSVYDNNATNSNIVRYHVPIPNRDLMYNANPTPSIQRIGYYEGFNLNQQSAPYGTLDGIYLNPSSYLTPDPAQRYSSTTVQADDATGSPFKIEITSSTYDAAKDSFHVSANITAYAAFPAGLTAQVALTIDSLTYKYDLSTDDPKQEFAPPIGTGAAGFSYPNAPDMYFDYLLKFTHVCEEMFPNSGLGTSLAAFTPGQTQTISFGWKKDHQWGAYYPAGPHRDSDYYDSSSTGQFVVFVQTNTAIAAEGIPAKYVFQSAHAPVTGVRSSLGIEAVVNNGTPFNLYPNPTNNNATLAFNLSQDQNVNVEVYNMLGEKVYADNEGMLSTGQHTIAINGSTLQNGLYLVRFITDGGTSTQKLLIQR